MEDSRPMADRIDLPLVNAGFRIFFSRDCVAWSIGLCLTQTFSFDREKHTAIAAHVKGGPSTRQLVKGRRGGLILCLCFAA